MDTTNNNNNPFGLVGPPPVTIEMLPQHPPLPSAQKQPAALTATLPTTTNTNSLVRSSQSTVFDPSQLTESDRVQLRQTILAHATQATDHFNRLRLLWVIIYYFLSALALAGNVLTFILSAVNINQAFGLDAGTVSTIVTFSTMVATIALTLNAQLQCHMNATYFGEARERWQSVQMLVWTDLAAAYSLVGKLEDTYDKSGVGPLVNLGGLISALTGSSGSGAKGTKGGVKSTSSGSHFKRHAYPGINTDL
jgi:hypothetical protein